MAFFPNALPGTPPSRETLSLSDIFVAPEGHALTFAVLSSFLWRAPHFTAATGCGQQRCGARLRRRARAASGAVAVTSGATRVGAAGGVTVRAGAATAGGAGGAVLIRGRRRESWRRGRGGARGDGA